MSKLYEYLKFGFDVKVDSLELQEITDIVLEESGFKWIPISDRQPDEMRDVLLSTVEGEYSGYRCGVTYYSSDCIELEEVAAWMKLPDPYIPSM